MDEFDTPWVAVGGRVLVDPADAADVAAVNALQDRFAVEASSAKPFAMPDYDTESFDATRKALLELARGTRRVRPRVRREGRRRPGSPPDRHGSRLGRASRSARRVTSASIPDKPVGEYELTVRGRPGRRLLVDLRVQRRRLLRAERPRCLQRQQHHRDPERRRIRHRPLRRLRRRPAELPPDHGGLELRRPACTARGPRFSTAPGRFPRSGRVEPTSSDARRG